MKSPALLVAAAARLEYLRAKTYAEERPKDYAVLVEIGEMKPLAELEARKIETESAWYKERMEQ